jgi:hypothetical protein
VARVLRTGMSGAGKSTLLAAVARRGYPTVDTDYDGWELPDALWDEPRMTALLAAHATIAVSGLAQNQGRFYDRFEHVIYLRVPAGGTARPGAHTDQQPIRNSRPTPGRHHQLCRRGRTLDSPDGDSRAGWTAADPGAGRPRGGVFVLLLTQKRTHMPPLVWREAAVTNGRPVRNSPPSGSIRSCHPRTGRTHVRPHHGGSLLRKHGGSDSANSSWLLRLQRSTDHVKLASRRLLSGSERLPRVEGGGSARNVNHCRPWNR